MYEALIPTSGTPLEIGPGCRRFDLPSSPGTRAWVVEIDAGCAWPFVDAHNDRGEMVLVLEGDLVEGERTLEAGTYVYFGPDSAHQPRSRHGVRLFGVNVASEQDSE